MFDPAQAVRDLVDTAYASGQAYASAMFTLAPIPNDPKWREQVRDHHCEALVRSVEQCPHYNLDSIGPGVFASALSGFEDRWRQLLADDAEAIRQAGEEMAAAGIKPRVIVTGLFDGKPNGS